MVAIIVIAADGADATSEIHIKVSAGVNAKMTTFDIEALDRCSFMKLLEQESTKEAIRDIFKGHG